MWNWKYCKKNSCGPVWASDPDLPGGVMQEGHEIWVRATSLSEYEEKGSETREHVRDNIDTKQISRKM
jgi:hypothetical protein